jgi:glycolate oxidase iron-sulfur subunit
MDEQLRELQEKINYKNTFDCVQCGYCLPACPTYETMGTETHSPRGRINLVKLYAEGKVGLEELEGPIGKCLGCNACQTVCPTNVEYGKILEGARSVIDEKKEKSKKENIVQDLIYNRIFPSRGWMRTIGNGTWLYQTFGLQPLARKTRLTSLVPLHLGQFEAVLPTLPSPKERKNRSSTIPPEGERKVRVGFFTGCVMDSVFAQNEYENH